MSEKQIGVYHYSAQSASIRYLFSMLSFFSSLFILVRIFSPFKQAPINLTDNPVNGIVTNPIPDQIIGRQQKFHFEIGVENTFKDPDGYNLTLTSDFNFPDPNSKWCASDSPALAGSLSLYYGRKNHKLIVSGGYAYSTSELGLIVIDISDPANMGIAGWCNGSPGIDLILYAKKVYVINNYATSSNTHGLQIFDVHNPANPMLLGTLDHKSLEDRIQGFSVTNTTVYLIHYHGLIQAIDVRNSYQPRLIGEVIFNANTAGTLYHGITVTGNYAYVAAGRRGVLVADVAEATNMKLISSHATDYPALRIIIVEKIAYVASGVGLQIFDINKPHNLVPLGHFYDVNATHSFNDFLVHQQHAYFLQGVTDNKGLLLDINIRNSTNPSLVKSYEVSYKSVAASGNHLYGFKSNILEAFSLYGASLAFNGIPSPQDRGQTAVTLHADNGHGSRASTSFNILVSCDPPKVNKKIADLRLLPNNPFSFLLPDDTFISDYGDWLSYTVHYENAHDDLLLPNRYWDPSWLSFDAEHGQFSGTPSSWDTDGITVFLTAEDEAEQSTTLFFKIKVIGTSQIKKALSIVATTLLAFSGMGITYYNRERVYRQLRRLKNQYLSAPIYQLTLIAKDDLEKGERLASGGFGTVYQGKWNYADVAVKEINEFSKNLLQDFINEVEMMSSLRHPNIVIIYGIANIYQANHPTEKGTEHKVSLIMELMAKGSLFNLLHDGNEILLSTKVRLALEIALGLLYLHSQAKPIIHRDIKSHNVLLTIENNQLHAKLTDFGLSKVRTEFNSRTHKASAAGTIRWMAPELINDNPVYSIASDIYAYGMVLWELISQKIPFSNASQNVVLRQWIRSGKHEIIPSHCPEPLARIIMACWNFKPEQRPQLTHIINELKSFSVSSNQPGEIQMRNVSAQSHFFRQKEVPATGSERLRLLDYTDPDDEELETSLVMGANDA